MVRNKLYSFMAGFCCLGYVWIGFNLIEAFYLEKSTITPCIFKNLTSFPCPSCGATRGLLEILAGNFLSGLLINPISWIYVVGMLVLPVWILLDFLNNSDSLFRFYLKFEYFVKQKLIACSAVILVVANWMWNFYKFY